MDKQYFRILLIIVGLFQLSQGCSIEGINWFVPETREILDIFRGVVFSSPTQDIQAINTVTQGEGLNGGPYILATLDNSRLIIETNSAFENYESIETETTLRYTILLRCTDSTTRSLVFIINLTDTNNNDPIFLPTNKYEFTIAPPVPPGFVVTTCLNDILVRDIDLTTQKIDYKIEGSELFEISFDPSSQVAKEFKATLRTTDLIRSLAEPIKLTVTATDVDLTEGPPRTATATVVIAADSQFQFPDEPIFSQPFYLANYESDNDVILPDKIFLKQGYDNLVKFSFESDHSEYFDLVVNENSLSFNMKAPIPVALYDERQIYLIVKATRQHTSGATATVIVKLPEDTRLEFENAIYEGTIKDNVLQLTDLKLIQGYEGFNITVDIDSEYSFRAKVESNVIKISMDPLAPEVIENNNFINLQITASNNRTTAVTVVTLEIIKDDYTTPVFENNLYSGSYSTETGLTLEEIILTQGFDETVKITLEGEYFKYFEMKQDGPKITLTSSTIPTDIFNERNIMITVLASKPRTVGAHAAVNIELPPARYLDFEKNIYEGTIENDDLILSNIVLTEGYALDVNFTLTGEYMSYFSVKTNQNAVTIEIKTVIPESILLENDILLLTLSAIGTNAISTSTSIVLQVIKEDHQTPVFSENLYSLTYENGELSSANIGLVQGFDETVTFELIGEHQKYFAIQRSLNFMNLILNSSIPEDVIFNDKTIILNIVAQKPRTVGANAAVYITFPQEMTEPTVMMFTQNAYNGELEGKNLNVDDIVLGTGYSPETKFVLSGEYSEYFTLQNSSNVVKLTPASDLPLEDLEENNLIILEVNATRERAISATTVVVIEILKTVIVSPVFEKAFYTGTYTSSNGLLFDELISLEKGFDNTAEFSLEEEFSKWFTLEQNENSVNLKVNAKNPIPEEVLENNSHLLFTVISSKPGAITGRATIHIDLPKEESPPTILQFENRQYLGIIANGTLRLENIRLLDVNISLLNFNLTGEFSKYFAISNLSDSIIIGYEELPMEVIENNTVVMLNVEASKINAISGHATIVLEIIKNEEQIIAPIFEEAFYTGQYSNSTGLVFSSAIKLAEGFDETVTFDLIEEDAKWFSLIYNGPNDLSLQLEGEGLNEITDRTNLVFTVVANKTNSPPARSAVIISLKDNSNVRILNFEQTSYLGNLENEMLEIGDILVLDGITSSMEFNITGDYASYFSISKQADSIKINLIEFSTELADNDFIILNLKVLEPGAVSGHATIVVNIVKNEENNTVTPVFSEAYYTGQYSKENGLVFLSVITLVEGYDDTVTFSLDNDDSKVFALKKNGLNNFSLILNGSLSEEENRSYLLFSVVAEKPNTNNGRAAIVISLTEPEIDNVSFDRILYNGKLDNGVLSHDKITLSGFTGTNILITGEHSALFKSELSNGVVKVEASGADFPKNLAYILLELQAASANAVLLIDVSVADPPEDKDASFDQILYNGKLDNGVLSHDKITLTGFTGTNIQITGEHSALFKSELSNGIVKVEASGADFPQNLAYISLELQAASANAVLLIDVSVSDPPEDKDASFDQILYNGKLDNGVLSHDKITLTGFTGTNILITGEHSALFTSELSNGVVKVEASGADFPKNLAYISLELQAASANAVLLIDVSVSDPPEDKDASFDQILYNGKLDNGVLSHDKITLTGFTGTNIQITGEHSALFKSELSNGVVKVEASGADFPQNLAYILLELQAASANAVLLIDVSVSDPPEDKDASFDQILYNGKLDNGVLSHDKITLTGFTGTNIQITGEHSALFKSELSNGVVKVEASGADFPQNLAYILLELQAASANAVLLIDVSVSDPPEDKDASFDQILYNGKLDNGVLSHDKITLTGFTGTNILITGEHSALFTSELSNGVVKVEASGADFPKNLAYISLELQAASANAVLLIDVSVSDPPEDKDASFDQILYNGKLDNGVLSHDKITLTGFTGTNIQITGEHSALFKSELSNGVVKVEASGADFPQNLAYILLELQAASANAVLLIDVSVSDPPEDKDASFDQILYNGKLDNGVLSHDKITLTGFTGTNIQIIGEHSALFTSDLSNGVVKVEASGADFPKNLAYISLELQAASANAVLLIDVSISDPPEDKDASFDQILYNGKLENGVLSHDKITLTGFTGTNILITGEHSALFTSELSNGVVKVEASGADFPKNLAYISLELQAASANAVLLIDVSVSDPPEDKDASFDQILYNGKLENGVLSHDKITLTGFTGTNILITGEHSALFTSELSNGVVKVEASGADFPKNLAYISLELQAASANAVLLIDVSVSDPPEDKDASFDQILYNGKLDNGVLSHDKITLTAFTGTNILITGEHSALFKSELSNGVVKVEASGADFPQNLAYILLELQAASANAVLMIDVSDTDPPEDKDVSFDQILYNGKLENGVLSHDKITLSGFTGTNILITGEHSALFKSELSNGIVKVESSGADFPQNLAYILLELQAASAHAVLLIDVSDSENPQLPKVSFKSQSYFLWADIQQTGVVGAVEASADNGEAIAYSLSEHIEGQININSNGEIYLIAAFDKGVYKFNAVATSVQSQVRAIAPVLLRVDTLPECSNEVGLSPLIILERLEEEPHLNLVVLNQTEHEGCQYILTDIFPKNQPWLYVDNGGLHSKAIDREDISIAFMTSSQIQVELTLDCDNDEVPAFAKRSLGTEDKSDLYSYDGPNKWVLTDTILFNARRSFVNLIVKDINDNSPIFLGKGNEPIYVGYPVSELEGTVLPRALAELKATDADIGENAAITYWSSEDNLAVSPTTGLIHVRNNAELENNSRLTIYAIDQNGKGRNGTIDIVVKLLDKNQIIVLTIRDAFLEDEVDVVNELSVAVGYEIKVLRAVVIPNNNEELSRRKRDVDRNNQASLQLYAYGLFESEPVDINQLSRDINNINVATVNIARIVSLEDHLEGLEICAVPGRDAGLLAATIVLAVLLLIAIVVIAVWFFLKWKPIKNYKQFSNRNSSASQSSSSNFPKIEVVPKLRPAIDEIKRTERRLQEMLETPIEKPVVRQAEDNVKPPIAKLDDTLVNISSQDAQLPIVIQSIDKLKDKTDESDDNDEFGEVKKPRKSVVTFNENVEKIIHIEDVPDDNSSESSLKIFKF